MTVHAEIGRNIMSAKLLCPCKIENCPTKIIFGLPNGLAYFKPYFVHWVNGELYRTAVITMSTVPLDAVEARSGESGAEL